MRTSKFVTCLVCFLLMVCIGCGTAMGEKSGKAGQQSTQTFSKKITKTVDCNYLLYLPADYDKE